MNERTHASFFSGVGGLDMGLERAGWRTVSFSEIDPYASEVLAERWPGVPNLGSIVPLASGTVQHERVQGVSPDPERHADASGDEWHTATLWTGGFPCQDLSVAGKRRGMGAGTRSGLAYAFLALAERHRPRFVLLENVPGLLSSHGGRDMAALIGALVELGYGVGYRVLDARHFGVPQRRRRVFILGDSLGGRAGAERAAEVLSVGSRCRRHPPTGIKAGSGVAAGARPGVDIARAVTGTSGKRHDDDTDTLIRTLREHVRPGSNTDHTVVVRPTPDPDGMRAPHGLAGRSHDRGGVATFVKNRRAGEDDTSPESWSEGDTAPTVDSVGHGPRTATAIVGASGMTADPLLPLGLDSHRYRCCGNGVVADVSYWIGLRLAAVA